MYTRLNFVLFKQGEVGEDSVTITPTWPAHIDVYELTKTVHSTLENDGVPAFFLLE